MRIFTPRNKIYKMTESACNVVFLPVLQMVHGTLVFDGPRLGKLTGTLRYFVKIADELSGLDDWESGHVA